MQRAKRVRSGADAVYVRLYPAGVVLLRAAWTVEAVRAQAEGEDHRPALFVANIFEEYIPKAVRALEAKDPSREIKIRLRREQALAIGHASQAFVEQLVDDHASADADDRDIRRTRIAAMALIEAAVAKPGRRSRRPWAEIAQDARRKLDALGDPTVNTRIKRARVRLKRLLAQAERTGIADLIAPLLSSASDERKNK